MIAHSRKSSLIAGDDLEEKVRIRKAVMSKDDIPDDVEEARRRWEKRRMDKQARGEVRNPHSCKVLQLIS